MVGKMHTHNGKKVYHRKDGALKIHGVRHSAYDLSKDLAIHAKRRPRPDYPHEGDKHFWI